MTPPKPSRDGAEVTVSCAEGDAGYVYTGRLPFTKETLDTSKLQRPRTHIMINVGNPADRLRGLPAPQ